MFKFFVEGIVQGVGFRPYIHSMAILNNLNGSVQNIGTGVVIIVDNRAKMEQILASPPSLARIDSIQISQVDEDITGFCIKASAGEGFAEIPADLFLCDTCLDELEDPKNRREDYYFMTCTHCGPRFSITNKSPYDRINTSMNVFPMCQTCKGEYTTTSDRRYHAQTIACKDCGPQLQLHIKGKKVSGDHSTLIKLAAEYLKTGEIVAIKGVGGYHLACTLNSVSKLRNLTKRDDKPYALMCNTMEMVDSIVEWNQQEATLLQSSIRPIVILKKKVELECSELDSVGVMLPYTALHYLLFDHFDEPLVMTSYNLPNEPIIYSVTTHFTDIVLSHEREIINPLDDSLIKVIDRHPLWLRRSRGIVPNSLSMASNKNILALGAEMNSCFAITKNKRIFLSQYLGTTSNLDAFSQYKETMKFFLDYLKVTPEIILCDKHPQYNTSIYAEELAQKYKVPLQKIQHHNAHAYSVAYEHNLKEFTAIVCDGLGYGEDGTIWGGEVFNNTKRVGHLQLHKQLGGDSATLHPQKMLLGILLSFLQPEIAQTYSTLSQVEIQLLTKQYHDESTLRTSSAGRVLDAVAALLGICDERTYEGRPAMLLEAYSSEPYDLKPVIENNILQTTPLFKYLIDNLDKDKERLAATAQLYLAKGLYEIAREYMQPIVFSGGCAYNSIMTTYLKEQGVLLNTDIPPGDGGIAYGQVAYHLANLTNSRDD